MFILMSRALTEWVRAPTLMKSTPVAATSAILGRVMLPDASVLARPPMILTASHIISVDILSSMMMSALASRASLTSSKLVASTSICMPGATLERTCSTALAIEPAILMWLSFIMAMSYRPMR